MSIRTPVCELLGIEHPIVSAPVGPATLAGSLQTQPAADIVTLARRLRHGQLHLARLGPG